MYYIQIIEPDKIFLQIKAYIYVSNAQAHSGKLSFI